MCVTADNVFSEEDIYVMTMIRHTIEGDSHPDAHGVRLRFALLSLNSGLEPERIKQELGVDFQKEFNGYATKVLSY
jgi:hypothetical protein